MNTSTVANVSSWEKFNRMVNVAKVRNESLNIKPASSKKELPKRAPLSLKLYSSDSAKAPKVAARGTKFDAYA